MVRFASVALLLLASGPAWAQDHGGHRLPPPNVTLGAEEVRVPLTFLGGRPVVEVRVGGKGPYPFLFDTGASGSVITRELATELKLAAVSKARVKAGGDGPDKKPLEADIVSLDGMGLGTAKLDNVLLVAMDLPRFKDTNTRPAGVLSPALFRHYLVTIDYPKKELRPCTGELPKPDDQTTFAYLEGRPIPSFKINVAGQEVETHLDSGSNQWLTLPNKFASTLPLDGQPVEAKQKARSVTGEFPVLEGKLKGKVAIGKLAYDNPAVAFSDVVRFGNLGGKFLERLVVTVDVENRRFRLEEEPAAKP